MKFVYIFVPDDGLFEKIFKDKEKSIINTKKRMYRN